jgi:hypothetical protein
MENGPREASGRTVRTGARDDKEMRERENAARGYGHGGEGGSRRGRIRRRAVPLRDEVGVGSVGQHRQRQSNVNLFSPSSSQPYFFTTFVIQHLISSITINFI